MSTRTTTLSDALRSQIGEALRPVHREFVERQSRFARQIMGEGVRLL
jgi:hypothetical protein